MPFSKSGDFHLNSQRAHAADRMGGDQRNPSMKETPKGPSAVDKMDNAPMNPEGQSKTEIHDNGDGTFHTKSHDGEETEHPHVGHMLMHLAAKHAEGKHMHMHHDGTSMVSHHVGEDGEVQGPDEHGSTQDAMDHMGKVMDGQEGMEDDHEAPGNATGDEDHAMYGALV